MRRLSKLILIGCLAILGWYWWQDHINPLTPDEQERKAAEDKRTQESNKKWLDTLQSATFTAMLIDPHLKYEFGAFHPLDLTQVLEAAFKAREVVRADADRFAANILPIIDSIRAAGITSYFGIAEALNSRGIHTARGGRWHATSVRNIIVRLAR